MGPKVRVLQSPGGGWNVQLDDQEGALSHHATQMEAIVEARRLAKGQKSKLLIHDRNGQIRERSDYANPRKSYARW